MKSKFVSTGILTAALMISASFALQADEDHEKIEKAMKDAFKGKTSIVAKASAGQASQEEIAKALKYWKDLASAKPPKGEMESWKKLTAAGVKAATALSEGKPNAADAFKKAANCKACHSKHKPD